MDLGAMNSDNPFAVFTFLVAPAILTNASTLLTLSTANRLARSVDRMRLIAAAVLAPEGSRPAGVPASLTRALAEAQFRPAARRCRVMIRALRGCYVAIGCFAAGTCVAMLGASLGFFGFEGGSRASVLVVIALSAAGVLAIAYAAANLVRESTSTLELLSAEESSIREALKRPAG
jgi:hypothetical protein